MTVLGFGLQMGVQLGGTLIGGLKKIYHFIFISCTCMLYGSWTSTFKTCGCYSITFLSQTLIFHWCVVR